MQETGFCWTVSSVCESHEGKLLDLLQRESDIYDYTTNRTLNNELKFIINHFFLIFHSRTSTRENVLNVFSRSVMTAHPTHIMLTETRYVLLININIQFLLSEILLQPQVEHFLPPHTNW